MKRTPIERQLEAALPEIAQLRDELAGAQVTIARQRDQNKDALCRAGVAERRVETFAREAREARAHITRP